MSMFCSSTPICISISFIAKPIFVGPQMKYFLFFTSFIVLLSISGHILPFRPFQSVFSSVIVMQVFRF